MVRDTQNWTDRLLERLSESGYRSFSADLDALGNVSGARRGDFRVEWALTKLHTFVFVQQVDVATASDLRALVEESTRYARRNKGGLPFGLQNGIAILPVLVCRVAEVEAVETAVSRPPKRFGTLALPAVVELGRDRFLTYHEPRFWGAYYQDFLGEQQRLIADTLSGDVLPPGGQRRANRWLLIGGVAGAVLALLLLVVPLLLRVL